MTKLQHRLRKLELHLNDSSGLVPHSQRWMGYWMREMDATIARCDPGPKRRIPIEAIRAWAQAQPNTDSAFENEV
jgi:hypothetical protein